MSGPSYIYLLDAVNYERLRLTSAPDGWEEQKVQILRSPTYKGLTRELSVELRFLKEGREYIREIYETEGIDYELWLGVYEYVQPPTDKYILFFSGLVDLSTYRIDELYVSCNVNESSLSSKLMARDDVRIDISGTETIGGEALEQLEPVTVVLHQRALQSAAIFELNEGASKTDDNLDATGENIRGWVMPIQIAGSDISNARTVTSAIINNLGSQFWDPSGFETNIVQVEGSFTGAIAPENQDGVNTTFKIAFRVYADNTFAVVETEVVVWEYFGKLEDLQSTGIYADFNETLSFGENAVVAFIFYHPPQISDNVVDWLNIRMNVTVNEFFDASLAEGYLMHEVGRKLVDSIADQNNAFFSNLLGRTDLGYPNNGEAALQTIHSGKQIRAIPNEFPATTFNEFFTSLDAQYSVGVGIEHDEFNQPFIRLEKLKHFFDGLVIATIHSVSDLSMEVAREWIYNDVIIGINKQEYEQKNGLEEPNNKFSWSLPVTSIKNRLGLVSEYRTDGYGIEFARRVQFQTNPTEDTKYDQDIFTIKVRPDNGQYLAEKNENYIKVENIFSPETAYNLDLSPGRMLRRHGSVIKAGVNKQGDKFMKFQYAEQKQNMVTQKVGEETEIVENQDILVNDLTDGLWLPELYKFTAPLSRKLLAAITRKPSGIIKFSVTTKENTTKYYYGWIVEINSDPQKRESEFKLLRVNKDSSEVVIIDPEGDTPYPEPDPPPETEQYGVFEGPFEFVFVNG